MILVTPARSTKWIRSVLAKSAKKSKQKWSPPCWNVPPLKFSQFSLNGRKQKKQNYSTNSAISAGASNMEQEKLNTLMDEVLPLCDDLNGSPNHLLILLIGGKKKNFFFF